MLIAKRVLPVNWTFFASCYGWGATSQYRVGAVARSLRHLSVLH